MTNAPHIDPGVTQRLLDWYDSAAVELPWRDRAGSARPEQAYLTWLSEIMLQQTQVETVRPYYARFLAAFPTVEALAAAPLDAVLKQWEGLGYYSRARNLHRAAQIIVRDHAGHFPQTIDELMRLPGVGRYTAGAIASIAFNVRAPVVDGNVIRVLARLADCDADVTQPAAREPLWALAEALLPEGRPGAFNQALMDFGRLVCRPRQPLCASCPLHTRCAAFERGTVDQRPVKATRQQTPHVDVTAGLIWDDAGRLLITRRPPEGLLGGLWEFPGGKLEAGETLAECLARELQEELAIAVEVGDLFVAVRHAFTHFRITLHAFTCRLHSDSGPPQALGVDAWTWARPEELDDYAFGKADRQVIAALRARGTMLL